ncbi:MAG: SDR family NAD(P)-dependent oxidoreductase [Planctomycetia bacterium]
MAHAPEKAANVTSNDDQKTNAGRTVLVTGSSTGLGKATAVGFARAGYKVAMNYANNTARAAAAFAELQAVGGPCGLFRGSVVDEADVRRLCDEITDALGPVDVLVLNATPAQPQKPIEEYEWSFYQEMIDYFLKSPYLLTRACLPGMKDRRWGRIVNITSEVFQLGVAPFTAYVAAKGAQTGFSRALARELAPFGVTVNMVAPGWIPVERHENDPRDAKDAYLATVPAGRWGTPDDVVGAALYFASREAAFVTGQTISVTGGHTVH